MQVLDRLHVNYLSPCELPSETPFDDDPEQRTDYLDCYRRGYQQAVIGLRSSFCQPPHRHHRCRGWHDGQAAGYVVFEAACREVLEAQGPSR